MQAINPETKHARLARCLRQVGAGTLHRDCLAVLTIMYFHAPNRCATYCRVSLTWLQKNLHKARHALVACLADLARWGYLVKERTSVTVEWCGFKVRRQGTNVYHFLGLAPEFRPQTGTNPASKKEAPIPGMGMAEAAAMRLAQMFKKEAADGEGLTGPPAVPL